MTTTPNDDTSALVVADAQDLAQRNPVEPGRVRPYRLYEDPVVRVRSIALDAGAALEAHTAPVPILVTVSEGRVRFDAAGASTSSAPVAWSASMRTSSTPCTRTSRRGSSW